MEKFISNEPFSAGWLVYVKCDICGFDYTPNQFYFLPVCVTTKETLRPGPIEEWRECGVFSKEADGSLKQCEGYVYTYIENGKVA